MYLKQIKVFCSVVEEGSFRRAADSLDLSQPSVSQQVAALERKHGVKFFERNGRGVALTPEGRALYTLGRELLKLSDSIPETLRDMQALQHGALSIGASYHAAETILATAVDDFKLSFPQISVSVRTGSSTAQLAGLKSGAVELAMVGKSLGMTHDPDLTVRALGGESLVLLVPRSHPWEGREVPASALRDAPLVGYVDDHPLALTLEDYFLRHQVRAEFGLKVDSSRMASRLVALGEYMAVVGRSLLAQTLPRERPASAQLVGLSEVRWEMHLAYRRSVGLSFAGWEMERRIERAAAGFFAKHG